MLYCGKVPNNLIHILHFTLFCVTSSTFSALLAICAGNSPVTGEFPAQRPVTRSFDFFFDMRLNKRLSKQSWGWWFETLSRPLWRHSTVLAMGPYYDCARVGVISEFPPFPYFPNLAALCKCALAIQCRVYIWLESPQFCCRDTSQI